MIKELLHDHEAIVNALRKDIDVCADQFHDVGTTDFLTKLIQQHETNAWVLRRYLG
jgi:starvation-inducible DNA-binding protein